MATPPPPPAPVPTLIVVGADSWLALDEQTDAYRDALGDRLELVTVPGGHTVYWDALDETGGCDRRLPARASVTGPLYRSGT